MNLNQTPAKIYDTIFFFIEYFNPKDIESGFTNVYDDTSFMLSCYEQVKAEVEDIPGYLSPLFLSPNGTVSPMSQFRSDYFDFENDNIDSFIVKIITNSDQIKDRTYNQVFGKSESKNYLEAIQSLDAPLEFKLQVSLLFGNFDYAIKTLTVLLKRVYLSVEKLNKKYEREIASRFEQIQSQVNIRAYQNFLKYDVSRIDSTEVSVCMLNQYVVYHVDTPKNFFMILGYKHEETFEKKANNVDIISPEQFILCCGNELRLKMLNAFCKHGELTTSQISQILDCPVTTTIRHINILSNNTLIFISKRDGLQIFYKINAVLFKKMKEKIDILFDTIPEGE